MKNYKYSKNIYFRDICTALESVSTHLGVHNFATAHTSAPRLRPRPPPATHPPPSPWPCDCAHPRGGHGKITAPKKGAEDAVFRHEVDGTC